MKIIELNYKRDYPAFLKLVKARPVTKEAAEQAAAEKTTKKIQQEAFNASRVGRYKDFKGVYADAQRKPRGGGNAPESEAWERLNHYLGGIS